MNEWTYEIYDTVTGAILKTDGSFETEEDAELQAIMEAKADRIKGYEIRTYQKWHD